MGPWFCRNNPRRIWGLAMWPLAGESRGGGSGRLFPATGLAGGEGTWVEEEEGSEGNLGVLSARAGTAGGGGSTGAGGRRWWRTVVDSRRARAWELPGSEGKVAGWPVWKEGGPG